MYDIVDARYVKDYILEITFENGKKGRVDFSCYLEKGGVFNNFRDLGYFKNFFIDPEVRVLCWPGNVDIAPETLYYKATGEPLPEWMEA